MQPTVTVILFNYNYAHYIETALTSIVKQTRLPDECIVMDDGSTDESVSIIKQYQKQYPYLKLIVNEQNCGINHNVMKALQIATGDFIWFFASDDKADPCFIEELYQAIIQYPDVGLVCSDPSFFINDQSIPYFHPLSQNSSLCHMSVKQIIKKMRRDRFWIPGHTSLINRKKLILSGGFITQLKWHTDWFTQIVIALRYGIAYVPKDLAHMRVREGTYSQSCNDISQQKQVIKAILKVLQKKQYRDIRKAFFKTDAIFTLTHGLRCLAVNPLLWSYLPLSALWRIVQLVARPWIRPLRCFIKQQLHL